MPMISQRQLPTHDESNIQAVFSGTEASNTTFVLKALYWCMWVEYWVLGLGILFLVSTAARRCELYRRSLIVLTPMIFNTIRGATTVFEYVSRVRTSRRTEMIYWAAGLRRMTIKSPSREHVHGSLIRLAVLGAVSACLIGTIYRDNFWCGLIGLIGFIELSFRAYCWLLELLCGHYGWRARKWEGRQPGVPDPQSTTIVQSNEEVAWQHEFHASWLTRLCFGHAGNRYGFFARSLGNKKTWWLGWLICFVFEILCFAASFCIGTAWIWYD